MSRTFRRSGRGAVKEALDNLPTGLCFFDRNDLPILCNRTMHRLAFALTGRDLQHRVELTCALAAPEPQQGVRREGDIFHLPDGSAWQFHHRTVRGEDGETYTEYRATEVTELCAKKAELDGDNARLRALSAQLKRMSANIAVATREEETLALKMRIHDQMGRSLVAARRILMQHQPAENMYAILKEWKRAVDLLRQAGDEPEEGDALAELTRISDGMLKITTTGSLPRESEPAYLLVTAIRECVTNALRYAHATELTAALTCGEGYAQAVITNNGIPPDGEITEGGGLSSLRQHIERSGGRMEVTSLPAFALKVTVPIGEEAGQ